MVTDLITAEPAETCDHPLADPDFALEYAESRAHIIRWWDIVTEIEKAPRTGRAIHAAAFLHGVPFRTMRNTYYAWLSGNAKNTRLARRDWRALADRRKYPDPKEANLPPAFVSWVKDVAERHQRDTSFAQAYRAIMAALALWERDPFNPDAKIPGYDGPPVRNAFTGHPEGWSEGNLQKRCKSNAYEKAVRRQGPKAASKFLPSVRTTRGPDADGRCLEFGEIMFFDDEEEDLRVNLTGVNAEATRPQTFNALEALSGNLFETGEKPQIWEGGILRGLNQLDFFWFVMLVLTKHGYNATSGTTLIWELGLSTVDKRDPRTTPQHFNNLISKVTNGKVTVDTSGRFGAPAFKEMIFGGQPSGNFKFKSPIESWFNLLRNYQGALPAPTGRNRDMAPEEAYGLVAENTRLLKLIDQIPVETFLRLKRPALEWEDYRNYRRLVINAINSRRKHKLEGWKKLGFTGARYRLGHDKPWIDEHDYQLIPAADRALYDQIVARRGNNEIFQLSPLEVFLMRKRQLTKLPMWIIPMVAPPRAWEPVKVTQSLEIIINDQWLDSEPLYFIAKVTTTKGLEVHLKRGETYKRLLNIFDPSKLWIADSKGSYIGLAARVETGSKLNQEAILRQLGEIHHVKAAEDAELHARMQSEAAKRVAARKFNRDLRDGKPVTMADRMQAIEDGKRVTSINEFLEAPVAAAEENLSQESEADVRNDAGPEDQTRPIASASDFL
jgi:hypothetical protein